MVTSCQALVGKLAIPAVVVAVVVAAGCDKKNDAPAPAPSSSTNTASKPSTSSSTTTASAGKKKLPGKKDHKVVQHAEQGGTGATQPSKQSSTTSEAATDRATRKEATVDEVDCATLPDNSAECDGKNFYFCDDKKLWVVDCEVEAKNLAMQTGACFEGDKFIDCLGCDTADDGTTVCCNTDLTVCCDHDDCYDTTQ